MADRKFYLAVREDTRGVYVEESEAEVARAAVKGGLIKHYRIHLDPDTLAPRLEEVTEANAPFRRGSVVANG